MKIIALISKWWLDTSLKTHLMVLTTLLVSLIMSGLTFWALAIIQEDSIIADTRFCQDLCLLLASNLLFIIENNSKELPGFIEKIYLNTSNIRYILLFSEDRTLFFGLPVYTDRIYSLFHLHQNLSQLEAQNFLFSIPLVKYNTIFHDDIIDIIIPLNGKGENFGSLNLGINCSAILTSSYQLIRNISVAIFVSVWLMFLIGMTFNACIFTGPIKQLLLGIKNIAAGNFNTRINVNVDGELGNLIISFNEMAARLESYEKKNVDHIMLEKMKLETIVSTIEDGTILVDTEFRFLFINQIAMKIFNWSNVDIIGKSIWNYFPLHINEALLPILNGFVQADNLNNFDCVTKELSINIDYDSPKVFHFLLTAVLDCNSHVLTSMAIIFRDISQIVKLNEAKNQFMANVSHELRTPLCNISSFLETLLDYHDNLKYYQKIRFLSIANSETKRLSALVNDILDLSKLESGFNYSLTHVDILSLINDIIQSYQLIASLNNIQLITEFDKSVKFVWAHSSSLSQVFANLLSNAIKFTSLQGQIILRIYVVNIVPIYSNLISDSPYYNYVVRIEIMDEGIGINRRDQKNIFDRFVRIENTIHSLKGTGLGLSIVKSILNKYNTDIFINSEPLVGTSLWFDLLPVL